MNEIIKENIENLYPDIGKISEIENIVIKKDFYGHQPKYECKIDNSDLVYEAFIIKKVNGSFTKKKEKFYLEGYEPIKDKDNSYVSKFQDGTDEYEIALFYKFGVFTSNSDTSTYIGVPLAGPAKTEKNKEDKEKDE